MDDYREIRAKRKDGSPVVVSFRDWGDSRPAYDEHGNVYEAYQSEWKIDGEAHFVVLDRRLAEAANRPSELRLTEDMAFLESMGIDAISVFDA